MRQQDVAWTFKPAISENGKSAIAINCNYYWITMDNILPIAINCNRLHVSCNQIIRLTNLIQQGHCIKAKAKP